MRYAVWNNKGGVGKSFLSFVLGTEIARNSPDQPVILADMCPQANLSEIVLGGNGEGSEALQGLLGEANRKTIGGYFDTRITSPHAITGSEATYLIRAAEYNKNLPENLYLIAGDPSLELQAQVMNQISQQTLPEDSWANVHRWLLDLLVACTNKLGSTDETTVIIDCNPSFSAYTEVAMVAAQRLILPCSADGSSARAIDNVGALLYGEGTTAHIKVGFNSRAKANGIALPVVSTVVLNRSTQYNQKASKAFGAMFDEIKGRVGKLRKASPGSFIPKGPNFCDVPDTHSVAVVCSHLGLPLYAVKPGPYTVHDERPQVNPEPLDRYVTAIAGLLQQL
jgi:cellulose biosynthesis protein BcsQ